MLPQAAGTSSLMRDGPLPGPSLASEIERGTVPLSLRVVCFSNQTFRPCQNKQGHRYRVEGAEVCEAASKVRGDGFRDLVGIF